MPYLSLSLSTYANHFVDALYIKFLYIIKHRGSVTNFCKGAANFFLQNLLEEQTRDISLQFFWAKIGQRPYNKGWRAYLATR
jgi:hypothetical protein